MQAVQAAEASYLTSRLTTCDRPEGRQRAPHPGPDHVIPHVTLPTDPMRPHVPPHVNPPSKGDNGRLSLDPAKNCIGVAALETLKLIGQPTCGVSLTLHKVRGFREGWRRAARGRWRRSS